MSAPIVSLATEAAKAGKYPTRFNKREAKMLESVQSFVGGFKVVAAGTHTSTNALSQSITVSGALSSDVAIVQVKTQGASPVTVSAAVAGAGSITAIMSALPSTDHVLSYILIRAV